ncbi:MAG: hypothetical protein M1834_007801 [Cirrosporium novae-zelandiae]|nr:MAG: hypothetical protein M1834_007801 [Cirrosporium novae-zelandiae]
MHSTNQRTKNPTNTRTPSPDADLEASYHTNSHCGNNNEDTIQSSKGGQSLYNSSGIPILMGCRPDHDDDQDTMVTLPPSTYNPTTDTNFKVKFEHDGDEETLPTRKYGNYSGSNSTSGVGTPIKHSGAEATLPPSVPPSYTQRFKDHMKGEVTRKGTDIVLIVCCFLSGLIDSVAFNGWGCFVSMQSGNTVFVGLGTSNHPDNASQRWAKALISIFCFLLGSFFFSRCSRYFGPLRRATLVSSFVLQSIITFVCAALEETGVVPSATDGNGANAPIHWIQLLPIGLLAFQSSGQVVTSRLLAFNDIPTVVLTTLYCDLVSDARLFASNWKTSGLRNRRVAAVVALFAGAVVGGWMSKTAGMGGALWLAAVIKFSIAVVWGFWAGEW